MINLLLVAPASDLPEVRSEVQNLINLDRVRVRVVQRPCTGMAVLDAIDRYGRFDAVHFAAHGGEAGVALDDGLWPGASLVQMVELAASEIIYLSTCDSVALAKRITQETSADCIATLAEQGDRRAAELATSFWRTVASVVEHPVTAYLRTARHDSNSIYVRSLLR